jgi:hypothetical protein
MTLPPHQQPNLPPRLPQPIPLLDPIPGPQSTLSRIEPSLIAIAAPGLGILDSLQTLKGRRLGCPSPLPRHLIAPLIRGTGQRRSLNRRGDRIEIRLLDDSATAAVTNIW